MLQTRVRWHPGLKHSLRQLSWAAYIRVSYELAPTWVGHVLFTVVAAAVICAVVGY